MLVHSHFISSEQHIIYCTNIGTLYTKTLFGCTVKGDNELEMEVRKRVHAITLFFFTRAYMYMYTVRTDE